ncbi:uncharacterized protein LOC110986891 [Acanthaster planci]|uniref:Uncharacterized protein LOC110986891 n=1 Tax=Acanthaster planci TaxID=133434 RepID=A0A8B7ZNB1_ACAPL|nr:uncharacterized protein LOC110986891 [Acanthaster planci]
MWGTKATGYIVRLALCVAVKSSLAMAVPASEEACRLCKCSNEGPKVVDCTQKGLTELPAGLPNDTQVLNLGGNELTRIPYDALLQLESLIMLNVTKNRISAPFEIPETVIILFAGENDLRDIKPLVKNGVNLQAVVFRDNNLQVIETDTFKRCQKLIKLDLAANNIREVKQRGLVGPYGMSSLKMEGNKLTTLGPDATEGLQTQQLILHDNNLQVLRPHTFGKARNLGILQMDSCKLEEVPAGLFVDPSGNHYERDIDRLDLGSNKIKGVSPGAFQGVTSFNSLQLSYNNLITLPEDTFAASKRIGVLILSNNQLVSSGLPHNLLINTSITTSLDISSNQLTTFPEKLLRSQHKLQNLYIHRNKISSLNSGAFKGMESLKELTMFDNPITYLPDWVFYETKLVNLYMFQTNLSAVGSRPFATTGKTLQQVSLYGSKVAEVPDSVWQDLGTNCYTAIDNSLRFAPISNRTDLKIELVGDGFAQPMDVTKVVARVLCRSGFQCRRAQKYLWQCTPCPQGHYGTYWTDLNYEKCLPCPAGGFYQSKTGQIAGKSKSINCQKCNNGTYVTPAAHPGISPADCVVCPTGTKKNLHAGFRACSCVDNYYRKDRFGECYLCPAEGLNCTGEYQHLLPGFWWTWDWGSDGNFRSYEQFVKNLRTIPPTKDHWTERFFGALPRVHPCPRAESCVNNGDSIRPTCDDGYEGWLCSECQKGYYSWFDRCFHCPTLGMFLLEVAAVAALIALVITLVVWDLRKNSRTSRSVISLILARFKIMLGFYQVMGEIFSDLDEIPWPGTLKDIGSFVKLLEVNVMQLIVSPRCYLPDFTYPNIYIEFVAGLGFLVGVVFAAWSFYILAVCSLLVKKTTVSRRKEVLATARQRCYLFVVMLLFVSYPSLSSVIFTLLPSGCDLFYLDENDVFNTTRLRSDFSIDCTTEQHVHFTQAARVSLSYVAGFPLVLLLLLWRSNRQKKSVGIWSGESGRRGSTSSNTQMESVEQSLCRLPGQATGNHSINAYNEQLMDGGSAPWRAPDTPHSSAEGQGHEKISWKTFLCENYKPQFWYWEVVELVRKIVQTLFVLLYGPDDHFTMFATIAISVGFLLIHAYVRPMKDAAEHRLQMCSLGAIFLNLLAASLLLLPTDEHSQSKEERKGALAVFLILLNLSIVVFVAGSLVWGGVKALWRCGCCSRTLTGLRWCLLQRRGSNENRDLDSSGESTSLVPGPEYLQRPYGEIIAERS